MTSNFVFQRLYSFTARTEQRHRTFSTMTKDISYFDKKVYEYKVFHADFFQCNRNYYFLGYSIVVEMLMNFLENVL